MGLTAHDRDMEQLFFSVHHLCPSFFISPLLIFPILMYAIIVDVNVNSADSHVQWTRHLILFVLCWNVSLRLYCTSVNNECRNPNCLCFYSACWMLSLHWCSIQPNYLCLSTIVCALFQRNSTCSFIFPHTLAVSGPWHGQLLRIRRHDKDGLSTDSSLCVSDPAALWLLTVENYYI